MASIFQPTSTEAQNVTSPTSPAGFNTKAVLQSASAAISVHQKLKGQAAIDATSTAVAAEQSQFVQHNREGNRDVELIRREEALREKLRQSPDGAEELAAVEQRVTALRASVRAGTKGSSEALARIQALKRKAAAASPLFADEIMRVGRPGTVASNPVADAAQAAVLKEREDMHEAGLIYDNPDHRAYFSKTRLEATRVQELNNKDVLNARELRELGETVVLGQVSMFQTKLSSLIKGGVENMDAPTRTELANQMSLYNTPEGASLYVTELLRERVGERSTQISSEDRERWVNYIWPRAKNIIDVLEGKRTEDVLNNLHSVETARAVARFTEDNPEFADALAVMQNFNLTNTPAATTVNSMTAEEVLHWSGLAVEGVLPPAEEDQGSLASTLSNLIGTATTAEDPVLLSSSAAYTAGSAKAIINKGGTVAPDYYKSWASDLARPGYIDQLRKILPAGEMKAFEATTAQAVKSYVRNEIVANILREVRPRRPLATPSAPVPVREVFPVAAKILNGKIVFVRRPIAQSESMATATDEFAVRLTKNYSRYMDASITAIQALRPELSAEEITNQLLGEFLDVETSQ